MYKTLQNQYFISVCAFEAVLRKFRFSVGHSSGEILPADFAFTSSSTYTFFVGGCRMALCTFSATRLDTIIHYKTPSVAQVSIRGCGTYVCNSEPRKKERLEKIIINSIASGVNAVDILDSYDRHMEYGCVETFTSFSEN